MSDPITITNVRDHIEKLNQEMDACLMRGDLPGYASFYSDEATIIGFEKRKIQGREAINQFCFAMTGIKEAKAVVLDVGMSGDFIYQVATSFARWERNGEEGSYFCDCMYVWRKEADNSYLILTSSPNRIQLSLTHTTRKIGTVTPTRETIRSSIRILVDIVLSMEIIGVTMKNRFFNRKCKYSIWKLKRLQKTKVKQIL